MDFKIKIYIIDIISKMSAANNSTLSLITKKRLINEMKLLTKDPLEVVDIYPDQENMMIWYFLIKGPKDTHYENGAYIGKLLLSDNYPVTPVDFNMITPNGRFECDKKICLTITGYHSDQWSSIWNIQKILGAFVSVMSDDENTGISHIKMTKEQRAILAQQSMEFNNKYHSDKLKNFSRFIKYNETTKLYEIKSYEQITAEMPVKKEKKKKEEPIDMSAIKFTSGDDKKDKNE